MSYKFHFFKFPAFRDLQPSGLGLRGGDEQTRGTFPEGQAASGLRGRPQVRHRLLQPQQGIVPPLLSTSQGLCQMRRVHQSCKSDVKNVSQSYSIRIVHEKL